MPHVVTQACCGDASCVYACPVNCIHPTPSEPDFGTSEMLYIDPSTCVDCGACVSACPVGAIMPGHRLPEDQARFADINAAHFDPATSGTVRFPVDAGRRLPLAPIDKPRRLAVDEPLSVGIVGSGPSAMYAADELLRHPQATVTIYERLDRPFGLARFGVAPDHLATRSVMRLFDDIAREPRCDIRLNVTVGADVSLDALRRRHQAVIWAGGAQIDRRLDLENADAPGVLSATALVGWYNGHPDHADLDVDLSGLRAVVIGNGNVALDVARILTTDPKSLADTSISRQALNALRRSAIDEVIVLGRRSAAHAAFTLPELVGLVDTGINVVVDPADLDSASDLVIDDATTQAKLELLGEASRRTPGDGPRIRLAFHRSPSAIRLGPDGRVVGLVTDHTRVGPTGAIEPMGTAETIDTSLVLTSIGYRGVAVPGLPFDDARGVIPHDAGRILDDGGLRPGMYVTGWIKRGPSGFIGTNKTDSAETVASLLSDHESGKLSARSAVSGMPGPLD
ncbi:4Fe-4S dicluster domain-containing protein [Gordonia sp. HNM0687]|uniref:4Fe-4S dicluster domain-containing protein n=1 Tax=Gordonia mangrovi TaxID=2665643 RepID=A0A6L7GW60_9ACTN|nr:4Fe-4S binding protein [Gordonia mangrovi]MXP22865.1 4Fe-4S dicluster domain-containing protein [Gordonia mangrovi]UVF77172.1 4Fe-4S binding protein [Gordonia mangrovi]